MLKIILISRCQGWTGIPQLGGTVLWVAGGVCKKCCGDFEKFKIIIDNTNSIMYNNMFMCF
jgi:hypothetical protein